MARLGPGEFAKYHALGNDYLVVDAARLGRRVTPAFVRKVCDRQRGVGSDGVLSLGRHGDGEFALSIWNPDGSRAEKSGNGVRIFARFLHDAGYTRRSEFVVVTESGPVPVRLHLRSGRVHDVTASMGRASFRSRDLPMTGPDREVVEEEIEAAGRTLRVTCVSVGNPHCVVFVPELDPTELQTLGPALERHAAFPKRTNVQLAHVVSRERIEILIWERGAGPTQASGSSSCAVAAAAVRRGLSDSRLLLDMPGGQLRVRVEDDGSLTLRGPATPVYRGRLLDRRP